MAKTGVDSDKRTVFVEQKVIVDAMIGQEGYEKVELSYSEAISVMAEWWEYIRSDGINVAAEIQMARSRIK